MTTYYFWLGREAVPQHRREETREFYLSYMRERLDRRAEDYD